MDISKILKEDQEGVWVDFINGTRIKLKPATPKMMNRLRKQCTNTYFKRGQQIEEFDNEKFVDSLSQAVICDWEGFESGGKKLPCTAENIKLLMDNWTEFNSFIQDAALHIERYLTEHEEQAAKN